MAMQLFNTQPGRVNRLKGAIIKGANAMEVLGITGSQHQLDMNSSDTLVFRRWLPYGGVDNRFIGSADGADAAFVNSHLTQEGVTPSADTLTAVDMPVQMKEYSALYSVSNRVVEMYEDGVEVPAEMKRQVGERIGLVREMARFGELKGLTNVFYGGTGNAPNTVNGTVTLKMLRKIAKSLKANHAKLVTSALSASAQYATSPIEASYLVFVSTDVEPAIRDLPGFKSTAEYGQRKVVHEMEIGSCEHFRFILSPELVGRPNQGAAKGTTGMQSTGGSNIDIYPMIVAAQDAWGQVALRGTKALDVTYVEPGVKDKNDPMGQRGYIGARTYFAVKILNDGWGALAWVGTPDLA